MTLTHNPNIEMKCKHSITIPKDCILCELEWQERNPNSRIDDNIDEECFDAEDEMVNESEDYDY